jgi:hypothetical protein
MVERLQPSWVSAESLGKLESLGLAESVIDRIVGLILDGLISLPSTQPLSGPAAAAADLLKRSQPSSAEELAQRITTLYEQHPRFLRLTPKLWLPHLERIANAELSHPPVELTELLRTHLDAQWLIIDALGVPFLESLKTVLDQSLPHWKLKAVRFGQVSSPTLTGRFYQQLIDDNFKKSFHKIDAVDQLIHSRAADLTALSRLVNAELEIALKRLREQFDPAQPIFIFGDHGFRISSDGARFAHGGPSTLERLAPAFLLVPISTDVRLKR